MVCQVLYNELPKYNEKRRSSISVSTLRNLQLSRGNNSQLFGNGSAHNGVSDIVHVSAAPRVRSSLRESLIDRYELLLEFCVDCSGLSTIEIKNAIIIIRLLVWRSESMSSEIRHMVLTVLNSFLWQSSLVSTNVTSFLEVFLNDMCYINPRFACLLYLLILLLLLWIFVAIFFW